VVLLELARAFSDARLADAPLWLALRDAFRPGLLLYAWFVVAVLGAGILALTLALGSARPNLAWDTPHEMLTPDVGCLSLALYGAFAVVVAPALMLPAAVSAFAVIDRPVVMWGLGLAIGLGVTLAAVAGAWWLALHEVPTIGE
jgi:hypothetical protein